MRYPRQQANVVGLVDNIIYGVSEHPEMFPHNDSAALQAARNEYALAEAALTDARSQYLQAAAEKQEKFDKMQSEMKKQIKIGVADNSHTPGNLSFIGWGTKRPPQQIEIPSPPTNLRITAQGDKGMLCLVWDKGRNNGGPVRSFIMERKQFNADWSEWQFVGTSFNNEIKLTKQPIGIKLEYQVRAGNASGQSLPSNTVTVIL